MTALQGSSGQACRLPLNRPDLSGRSALRSGLCPIRFTTFLGFLTLLFGLAAALPSSAQTTLSTVSTGSPTVGLAVNPTQNIIYVTHGDNTLTYIDGWTNTVHQVKDPGAATTNGASAILTYLNGVFVANSASNDIVAYYVVPQGGYTFEQLVKDPNALQPAAMVFSPNGFGTLYVANKGSNSVSVFVNNGSGLQFTAAISVGAQPDAMVMDLASNRIYVANYADGTVSVVDGSSNTVVTTIQVGMHPTSLALNAPSNKIYVADQGSNDVMVINGATNIASSISGISTAPTAIATSPLSGQIFVATLDGHVDVIDGSTDTVTHVLSAQAGTSPAGQAAIVVDPTTDEVFVSIQGGNLTAIDGGTLAETNPPVGPGGTAALALNPVTHRVYADNASNSIAVVDGSTNAFNTLTLGQIQPWAIAVNPATNKVYVANYGSNSVTAYDPNAGTTSNIPTGGNPDAIAIDLAKNLVYVADFTGSVTIIDASNDQVESQTIDVANPDSIAVDPIRGLVFGASSTQSAAFNFPSNFGPNPWTSGPTSNVGPIASLANPAAGVAYTLFRDGNLEVADESTPHSFIVGVCGTTASQPTAMDVNPTTNTVYVACSGKEVDAVIHAGGFLGGVSAVYQDPSAISPVAVAVNPITNKIFVANAGDGSGNGSVTVIDGATGSVTNLSTGGTPVGVAVNLASGKVYVQMKTTGANGAIYAIDPTGQYFLGGSTPEGSIGPLNTQIATDPINNTVYALDRLSNTVSYIAESTPQGNAGPSTTIQPFTNNIWTTSATPTFNFSATAGLDGYGPYAVYFQVDTLTGPWSYAGSTGTSGSFSGIYSLPLTPGFHVVYAYSTSGYETNNLDSNNGAGFQYGPFVGAIASYGFIVAPPNAGTSFLANFGSVAQGTTSAPQQAILVNHGGAPLNFTYTFTGPNATDFAEVPYTGSDPLCNTLAGVLAPGSYCDVNVAFHPTAAGAEVAEVEFLDNSLGIADTPSVVVLEGFSQAPGQTLSVAITGNGAGTISDGSGFTCSTTTYCNHVYTPGAQVTLTATPSAGSIFYGWDGACTGSGTCTLTMNSNQIVAAIFTTAIPSHCAPSDTTWIGGPSGNWSNPANWSTAAVPVSGAHVCINGAKSPVSSVTLDVSASVGGLTIDPGNSLTISDNLQFIVAGTLSNSGQITLNASGHNTFLTFSGSVTITGGGTITLIQTTSGGQPILNNTNNGAFTNVDNTIQGAGQIGNNGLHITNQVSGVISANNASFPLTLNNNVTNLGTIQSSGSGTLQIAAVIANSAATVRTLSSTSSVLLLGNASIQGGIVNNAAGGTFATPTGNVGNLDGKTLGALTLFGTYTTQDNATTVLFGAIDNAGTLLLQSAGHNTFLTFNSAVTLSGGGTVDMSLTTLGGQPILNNTNAGSLTNFNNLIQGAGQIGNNGLVITNQAAGIINANNSSSPLFINSNLTNQGLLEATGNGTLQISSVIQNQNANVTVGAASASILLVGGDIVGGTITNTLGGTFATVAGNSASLDGITSGALTIVGTFASLDNSTTTFFGSINNTGTIVIQAAGHNTFFNCNNIVTLSGGGTVNLSQASSSGQPIINNSNAGALVNVNNLIEGAGQIGNNGLGITNQAAGVISATNPSFPLGINNNSTNLGLIQANGGTLQLSAQVVNQGAAIRTVSGGSAIQLFSGANIQGGTLTSAAGGSITTVVGQNPALNGLTSGALTLAGTITIVDNGNATLFGTINNTGVLDLQSNGHNSFLVCNNAVTLTGNGTVFLDQLASGGQPIINNANAGSLTNVSNLIEGAGQIGNNGLGITNQAAGVISATNPSFPLGINNNSTNLGLIQANGGTLQLSAQVVNQGAAIRTVSGGSAIQLFSGANIQGGTLTSAAGGSITTVVGQNPALNGLTSGALTLAGTITIVDNGNATLFGTINNTGVLDLQSNGHNSFLVCNNAVTLTGNGTVFLDQLASGGQPIINNANAGSLTNVSNLIEGAGQIGNNGLPFTNGSAGRVLGNSAFSLSLNGSSVTNQGQMQQTGASSSGILSVNNLTQTSTGHFGISIASPTQYSQWQDTGNTTLAGNLDIAFANGFTPALNNQFTVLTTHSRSGQFAAINSPSLPSGLAWQATYNPGSVVLTVVAGTGGTSTLTVTPQGTGTGTITDDFGLINCTTTGGVISGNCSAGYLTGSIVALTAIPASGTNFNGFTGCTGAAPCIVTVSGPQTVTASFVPANSFTLNVTLIGTGNGTITDNFNQINCVDAAGVISGACSASYPVGAVVNLSATPNSGATFGGWLGACTGTAGCSVTMNSAQSVTASLVPPPQNIPLTFAAGTNVSGMATYDCPSNPSPSPTNPCLDPNAHALALNVGQVLTPFTLTVQATEVPPTSGDGICTNGDTPTQDFDCRFKSFFTFQTNPNGDTVVPLCYPYANGNCVHYTVFYQNPGTEPDPSWYVGPVNWTITFNNDTFVPPAPYTGSTPRLYDDPDGFVLPNSPYGTDCNTPMLIGNPGVPSNPPIYCQFVFDITTFYDPNKKVDAGIGGKTRVFNDVGVAIPPSSAASLTVPSTPDAATVSAGTPIGITVMVTNSSGGTATGATLHDSLPAGAGLWTISPAYSGPGSCTTTGAVNAQVLNCSFGDLAPSATLSLHILSATSSAGTLTNTATIAAANQQVLSIASVVVQPVTPVFSGLTPSQSIAAGTPSITLAGVIGNGSFFPASGETISITINGITQLATIGANGVFSLQFATAAIPVSATPYTIAYSYVGDSIFASAADSSTTLTVTSGVVLQSIVLAPANPTLTPNAKLTFIATGFYSNGSSQNVSSLVTWSSDTPSVAAINSAGVATAIAQGTSTITASLSGVIGTTLLTVNGAAAIAYIGDAVSANCCLDVINTSTNKVVTTIPVTNINEPLGITPDQSRIFVPDSSANVVDVIDTTTNTLVNVIPVGNGTTAVAITPDGKFGYVSDFGDNNVPVFDVATGAVVATIPIGFPSPWLAVTPDGAYVYASSAIDGRVAVINTSTNSLSSTFTLTPATGQPAPGCITGPTFNPSGTLAYFAQSCLAKSTSPGTVSVVSIPANTLVTNIVVGTDPFQTIISPDGTRLYVANAISNTISVVDTSTNSVVATVSTIKHPESLGITPDGAFVYIANTGGGAISVLQTSSNTITATIPATVPFGILIASPPAASNSATLALTPPNLVFNSQINGTTSAAQTISVKNPGTSAVTLTSIALSGPNVSDFTLTSGCPAPPATLGSGASCNLQVSYHPLVNGSSTALVTITAANGLASSTQSAPLSGTGISLVSIAVTPSAQSIMAGSTLQFTATGTYSDNSTLVLTNAVWSSSLPGVAGISSSGLATGVSPGQTTISATVGNIFGSTTLNVTPLVTLPLSVTLIGTGSGSVTDNFGSINCVSAAGVISGACSANYPVGTLVTLTATPTAPSAFAGWLGACTGTAGCSVTMNSAQSVTASLVPPPQNIPLTFAAGTNVSGMATYDCPSNPSPSPTNPCLDPNAHALALNVGQVLTPFTLTVQATEVPPTSGDGICTNGDTPTQDFDCRFKSFFTFQTNPNGDTVVPLCYPYANGNCVHYTVFYQNPGTEPDPSWYVGPVNWTITFNNDTFVPPAPYTGSTPRLYDDPDGFVLPNSPYGTDCNTPMLIGNPGVPSNPPIYCQFVFDITTFYDPNKKVDAGIGGKTRVFNDVVVAIPPVNTPVVTVTTTSDASPVNAGSPIGFTIAVSNSLSATASNASLNNPLPAGANINWSISPAYSGPGSCTITGAVGSQVLNCSFGNLSPGANLSLHVQSASSSSGTYICSSTVVFAGQQILSIGSITVQALPAAFSGIKPSQSIPVGTSSISLSGTIASGTQYPPSGETVSVAINGAKQIATIGGNGAFSLQFPTASIPASTTPYTITYSFAGDSTFSPASDTSTSLAVVAGGKPGSTIKPLGSGTQNGVFYQDVQIANSGTGVDINVAITSLVFRTLAGTGTVTLNTSLSPALPDNLGNLNVGQAVTVRLFLNVPTSVTRFLLTENGTLSDASGTHYTFSAAQVINY